MKKATREKILMASRAVMLCGFGALAGFSSRGNILFGIAGLCGVLALGTWAATVEDSL